MPPKGVVCAFVPARVHSRAKPGSRWSGLEGGRGLSPQLSLGRDTPTMHVTNTDSSNSRTDASKAGTSQLPGAACQPCCPSLPAPLAPLTSSPCAQPSSTLTSKPHSAPHLLLSFRKSSSSPASSVSSSSSCSLSPADSPSSPAGSSLLQLPTD